MELKNLLTPWNWFKKEEESRSTPSQALSKTTDQFCPPARATAAVSGWPDVDLEVIPSADHFLFGATAALAERTCDWIAAAINAA